MARSLLKREKIDSSQKYNYERLEPLLYECAYSYCNLSTSSTLIDLYQKMVDRENDQGGDRENDRTVVCSVIRTTELLKKCIERYSSVKDGIGIVKACFSLLNNHINTVNSISTLSFRQYIFIESIESNNYNMVYYMIEQFSDMTSSFLTRMLSLFIMVYNPSSDLSIPIILLKHGARLTGVSTTNMIYTNRIKLVQIMIEITTSMQRPIRIKKRHLEFAIRTNKYRMLRLIVPIASRSVKQGSLKRMSRLNLIGTRVKELLSV